CCLFSSRRRHTRSYGDWSSDVCSSDLPSSAPVPLRMMGAKALVPMGPKEMATALFMLTFDADAAIREAATKSAAGLPDRILSVEIGRASCRERGKVGGVAVGFRDGVWR